MRPVKVLFLLPYPLHKAPSQRFRIEAYFPLLKENGFQIDTSVFLDEKAWAILYKRGSVLQKTLAVLKGFVKRWWICLFLVNKYDFIVVHREAAPIGPPFFEWIIARVWKKMMIYDFDDAIWIPDASGQNAIAAFVKSFWKIKWICKWAHKISAGNKYLADFAKQYNPHSVIVPTVVDAENRYNFPVNQEVLKPSLGWTGSHSTLKYLDSILPVLQRLEKDFDFDFYVICNKPPSFNFQSLKFIEWKEATEIEDLSKINIGLMPLKDDQWSEGKCGFKIIQYLALGIPAIASPVGVNKHIIDQGINGFLCSSEDEWLKALALLLSDASLRKEMAEKGREKIVNEYSLQANEAAFLSLFD